MEKLDFETLTEVDLLAIGGAGEEYQIEIDGSATPGDARSSTPYRDTVGPERPPQRQETQQTQTLGERFNAALQRVADSGYGQPYNPRRGN
ncbi:MAG: hypothetical protein LBJ83_01465 [Oscillospiraceae bacterium]|jgi:hypothetical protein|nr:hypothetical protein [Oscillospiraceae bacterium]